MTRFPAPSPAPLFDPADRAVPSFRDAGVRQVPTVAGTASTARIARFGEVPEAPAPDRRSRSARGASVRVAHASVGITDVMAARGDYLLQPAPGFVPGYDFVGVIEDLPASSSERLAVGQRVAGVLPHMGAHADRIHVDPSLLVPVPEAVETDVAATVPLDALTAWFSLTALPAAGGSVLIQGAGGAVGAWAAQLANAWGTRVYGTASARSREVAEASGAEVFDYRDAGWISSLRARTSGGVDGAIDHTGSHGIRRALKPGGTLVRTAFGDDPGHQLAATARGFLTATVRRWADPRERVCSIPMLLLTQRDACRHALTRVFAALAAGELHAPTPEVRPFRQYRSALSAAQQPAPGTKIILQMQDRR